MGKFSLRWFSVFKNKMGLVGYFFPFICCCLGHLDTTQTNNAPRVAPRRHRATGTLTDGNADPLTMPALILDQRFPQ